MHFELTEEQQQIKMSVREFAESEIAPHVLEWDESQHFPIELKPQLAELGLMGVLFPEEYGGAGMGYVEYANVPTARPSQVDHIQFMRGEHPNRIRTDQEVIGVEVERGFIIHIMQIELCRITSDEKILPVEVSNSDTLIAPAEGIEPAVRLFLQHIKVGQVVLIAVITQIAK